MAFMAFILNLDRIIGCIPHIFSNVFALFFLEAPFFCSLVHQDCDKFWDLNYKEQCNGPCTGWWGEDGCFRCVMGWVGPKVGLVHVHLGPMKIAGHLVRPMPFPVHGCGLVEDVEMGRDLSIPCFGKWSFHPLLCG